MFNDDLLVEVVTNRGKTMAAVAEAIGIDESTLYRKRKGISEFTAKDIKGIRKFLDLNVSEMDCIFFAEELAETQVS